MKYLALTLMLTLLAAGSGWAQGTGQITGTVSDPTGAPLPGTAVSVADRGALTGSDGRYTISGVPAGIHPVRASLIGYGTSTRQVTVTAGRTATADFQLQTEAVALDELVVIGYGTVRRSDLTGSTSPIKTREIEDLPLTSVEQALQGRAAGVQVIQSSGAPGGNFIVRIRGGNSMRGGNDPLYVVDGFPIAIGGDEGRNILNLIDPDNIESIEILKDASATAIYGARGANGVVMITTKKGRPGSRVEFETYAGVQEVARRIPVMNARQFAELANELAVNEGLKDTPFPDLNNLPGNTDWQDEIFRTAPIQNYSINFSGGDERTRFLLAGNYLDQQGIIRSSDLGRASVRLNLDSRVSERFRISNQLMLARSETDGVQTNNEALSVIHNAFVAPPLIPVYDADGNYFDYSNYFFVSGYPRHPIADINEITDERTNFRILESFSAEYDLLEGLTAKSLFGADYLDTKTDYYVTRLHETGGTGGSGRAGRGEVLVYLNENTLNYAADLGQSSRINLTGGFTWQRSDGSGLSAAGSGFVNDILQNKVLGTGTTISPPGTSASNWTLMSWLGRANYTLFDRYLLTVSGRADGSSRFGAGNKWAFFPSAALAWRASDEPFLAGSDLVSNLKLRVSWGRTGSQEIGLYNSLQRIAPDVLVMGNSLATAYAPVNIANPDLRWETTDQYNAGFDLGLWNERLTFVADAYVKNTSDLLASVNLPSSSGFSSMLRNVGAMRNTGVELSLGGTPVDNASLQWTIDGNVSFNRNEVVELAQGNEFMGPGTGLHGGIHLIREGEPLSVFYGFVEDGLDETGAIRYVDTNGDGAINDMDRTILGTPYPDFTLGLNSSVSVGAFELDASVQGVFGNEIYNSNLAFVAASFSRGENQLVEVYENHWSPANPDPNAKYPRLSAQTLFRPSDRFVEDGSYMRLKTVRLGYRVPVGSIGWTGADDMLLYVSGQNLLTLTDYSWYDPEISRFGDNDLRIGVDNFGYPQARTVMVGIRMAM